MDQPAVSVVIPTYNRVNLLPRAIDSVLAQTFADWELLIVDDGSTDGTAAMVAEYVRRFGERVRYTHRENGGCGRARNTGIDLARGRFIAFLDSDDEFLPNKLARQMELFELRPELGLVYSDYAYIDIDGAYHESVFDELSPLAHTVPHTEIKPGLCVCTGSLFDTLIHGYFVSTIVGLVRREVLGDDIRYAADRAYAEEWLFYLRVARCCPAGFVKEPLCLHHHVAGSLTRTSRRGNSHRQMQLLRSIRETFPDLAGDHKQLINDYLLRTTRQLGYDAYREGCYAEAARWFADAFLIWPQLGPLSEAVQAAGLALLPKRWRGRRAGSSATQADARPVR